MPEVTEGKNGVDRRKVFVIHGRNDRARQGLFTFLRAIGLDPIEWSEASRMTGKGSPYIGEILDAAFGSAQAVVVLQTPDDVTYLHESLAESGDPECSPQMQPRPNVLFEAGMAMGRDADRTVIVELGQIKVFSDIHGRHVVRLDNSVKKRQDLANRLETAGCATNLTGTDWHEAGDLTPPVSPGNGLPMGRKLPSSQASGRPRLHARYIDNGRNKLGAVQITNHGPGDVYELDVDADDEVGLVTRNASEFPIPNLPAGKSVSVLRMSNDGLGRQSNSYFNITITGKTADGTPITVNEFVSGA
ncbi:TIR domain-containing protein [Streptomyces mirabilis]|uniref:TIR domain-containing protein n=1 Tax=Streptomyces mirabilis TaxID=68239 RepID=UPI00366022BF